MAFTEYNINNIGSHIKIITLSSVWVEPVYENCNSAQVDLSALDTAIKRKVAGSLPPSPTKKQQQRSRANTVGAIAQTSLSKKKPTLENVTNTQPLKSALRKIDTPKAFAEEIPKWWTPNLPSFFTYAQCNIGHSPNFDRQIVYEYLRDIRYMQKNVATSYQNHLEKFQPSTLTKLLKVIRDQTFIDELKRFNSMINDTDIKAVETSFLSARTVATKNLFH